MSGSGEYTTTPNLGLFKPTYNADAENWGFHLNSNSDTLDAALQGGGSYIATGGTVPRTAQDRAADVANVLDFDADPTGALDSSGAINAAATGLASNSRRKSVYLPAGTYHVRSRITLSAGQTLFGDGRGNTIITVSDDFDPAETVCVIALDGGSFALTPGGDQPGPIVRDLGISFQQPMSVTSRATFKTLAAGGTSGPGGTGVKYPWAIAPISNCRPKIVRVRISAAWDGFTTNGVNAPFWIENMEMGALDVGLSTGEGGGVYDWSHINGYHFWPFGMDIDPISTNVFADLQTIAMRVGLQNGLEARGIGSYQGRVVFTSEAVNCWADITNLNLDNSGARLEIAAGRYLHFANVSAIGNNSLGSMIKIDGGLVSFTNLYSQHANQAQLEVTGGDVTVMNGVMQQFNTVAGCASVSGGTLRMSGVRAHAAVTGTWTQPLIGQFTTGVLQLDNVAITGIAGASGPGIFYYADVAGNLLGDVTLASGWTTFHAAGSLGLYGPWLAAAGGTVAGSLAVTGALSVAGAVSGAGFQPMIAPSVPDATSLQLGSTRFNAVFSATGHNSTAFGNAALGQHTDAGNSNAAFGAIAGYGVLAGINNSFFGYASGYAPSPGIDGTNNSCFGALSGYALTTGSDNCIFGQFTGATITTGSRNLLFGKGIQTPTAATNDYISVGDILKVTGSGTPATSAASIAGSLAIGGTAGPTFRAGTGAAAGTQPKGSIWMRTDGAVGSTLYVTQGGGTWAAVAGV